MSLVGKLMANPSKFKEEVKVGTIEGLEDGSINLQLNLKGELAAAVVEFLK